MAASGRLWSSLATVALALTMLTITACEPTTTSVDNGSVAAPSAEPTEPTQEPATSTPTPTGPSAPTKTATPTPTPTPTLRPGKAIMKVGSQSKQVRELQARLKQLDWYDGRVTGNYGKVTAKAVSGFQAKRGFPVTGEVDKRTWDKIVSMSRTPTRAQLYPEEQENAAPASLDKRCLTGKVICISKADRRVRWVVDGQVKISLAARFGSQFTPTREGTFSVYLKSRDHWSNLYDTPMPFSLFFSGGQAVHYSYDFAKNGYNGASHGCVNTRDWNKMERLFNETKVGTKVVVY